MWLVFFDLDETLISTEVSRKKLTATQLQNLNSSATFDLIGWSNTYQEFLSLTCSPLYQTEHRIFFSNLANLQSPPLVTIVTSGTHTQDSVAKVLQLFFSLDRKTEKFLSTINVINREILMHHAPASISPKADNYGGRLKANFLSFWYELYTEDCPAVPDKTRRDKCVLIDDDIGNREAARNEGFFTIKPTDADYPRSLELLAQMVQN